VQHERTCVVLILRDCEATGTHCLPLVWLNLERDPATNNLLLGLNRAIDVGEEVCNPFQVLEYDRHRLVYWLGRLMYTRSDKQIHDHSAWQEFH
jgi:hypothetical protein